MQRLRVCQQSLIAAKGAAAVQELGEVVAAEDVGLQRHGPLQITP